MTTAAMPPVGPLTSTENLLPGDILRVVNTCRLGPAVGSLVSVVRTDNEDVWINPKSDADAWLANRFAFVARPGVWMPWNGGENPVPGMTVKVRGLMGQNESGVPSASEDFVWSTGFRPIPIREYMVVTDARQPRKGDPVEPPFGCQPLPQDRKGVDPVIAFADVLNGRVGRINAPGKWTVSRDDNRVIYEAHGDPCAQPEQKPARTAKPEDLRHGDRVRVSFEVEVQSETNHENRHVTKDVLANLSARFGAAIELLDRPLAVGDRVIGPYSDEVGTIRHIAQGIAAVEFASDFRTIAIDDLGAA